MMNQKQIYPKIALGMHLIDFFVLFSGLIEAQKYTGGLDFIFILNVDHVGSGLDYC